MTIKDISVDLLSEYENNPRINDLAVDKVAESIRQFGFKVPIIVDKNNIIVAGHTRLKAARKLGLKKVPCIVADDLNAEQIKAFRLADNKVSEFAKWDEDKLYNKLLELKVVNFDIETFGFETKNIDTSESEIDKILEKFETENNTTTTPTDNEDNPYTTKIDIPQYEITGEQPTLSELVDTSKSDELIKEINNSSLSDEEKEFLIKASYRHNVFDYSKIAEYYAHAPKETQELMEKSALVIIDFNDAIKNGYAYLSDEIQKLYSEDTSDET